MNSLGRLFRLTIFGESHGPAVGVIIDGCPPGLEIKESDLTADLDRRRSGAPGTTARQESDQPRFLSGVWNNHTTGAPLTIVFENIAQRSADYAEKPTVFRPGHADFTAHRTFQGWNDARGGGYFSGRMKIGLVAAGALAEARRTGRDVMIVDTAGRLAIDAELMGQVRRISDEVSPDYTFLVVDAMTGQDAVGVAESFHQTLELDGVILTKLDGDARGGAALSVKEVVGRPIAFASTGEKLDDFELFHPDRLAGRILGMGDMLTLIEKAEAVYETEEAEVAAERMMAGTFTLDDFLDQLAAIKKMGPLQNLVGMMPGMPKEIRDVELEDSHLARVEAIIHSMNRAERNEPDIVDGSRRARIAKGSGTSPGEVSQLLSQFGEMRKMMQSMGDGFSKQKARKMKKNKKKVRKKGGGRTTPKGSNAPKIPAGAFQLPQLDERGNPVGGGLPEGFPGLG